MPSRLSVRVAPWLAATTVVSLPTATLTVQAAPASASVGTAAPEFTLTDTNGKSHALSSFKGKHVVLFFYPLDFTFVCPTELEDLADLYADFQKLGVEIYAVSTDTHFTHKAWHDTSETIRKIQYVMVGDPAGQLTRNFDVMRDGVGLADLAPVLLALPQPLLHELLTEVLVDGPLGDLAEVDDHLVHQRPELPFEHVEDRADRLLARRVHDAGQGEQGQTGADHGFTSWVPEWGRSPAG